MTVQIGSIVKIQIAGPNGPMIVAGTVKRILSGGVELKTQLHGYHVVPAAAVKGVR